MLGVWSRLICFFFRLFRPLLFPFAETVPKKIEMWSHDNGVLYKLFHAVNESVPIPARHQPTPSVLLGELLVCHGYGALVWYDEHAHPSTEYPESINSVERLRPAIHLCDSQSATLSRTNRAGGERYPIDLVLEDSRLQRDIVSLASSNYMSLPGGHLQEFHVVQGISICARRSIYSVRATLALLDVYVVRRL
jgi:hypothetical protein